MSTTVREKDTREVEVCLLRVLELVQDGRRELPDVPPVEEEGDEARNHDGVREDEDDKV